jgi:hypothetical protein
MMSVSFRENQRKLVHENRRAVSREAWTDFPSATPRGIVGEKLRVWKPEIRIDNVCDNWRDCPTRTAQAFCARIARTVSVRSAETLAARIPVSFGPRIAETFAARAGGKF